MVKVSIIVPVYNTEKYLEECLDSLVNQTLEDIEIICIDDGSTDNSFEILKTYERKDKRIKVLQQANKKQGAARNYGIREAIGEYIGFVDSDDWAELDMFEKLYNKAISTDSDITMCKVIDYNENTKTYSKSNWYSNLKIFPESFFNKVFSPEDTYKFLFNICVYPCNKILKREFIINKKAYFPENIYCEDAIYFFKIWLNAQKISLIKDYCYYYRLFSDNSTTHKNDLCYIDAIKSLKYKEDILRKLGLYKKLESKYLKHKSCAILYWFKQIKSLNIKIWFLTLLIFTAPSYIIPIIIYEHEILKFLFTLKALDLKKKRVLFWGASLFLEAFINKYNITNENIIGIIDKDPEKNGKMLGGYKIYSPEFIKELNPDSIVIAIEHYPNKRKHQIYNYLKQNKLEHIKLIKLNNNSVQKYIRKHFLCKKK